MGFKWFFGLLTGYAAGMALAIKYQKDKKNKDASFLDEVVDIHKSAYSDVRDFVVMNFEDVETWDDLQAKGKEITDSFMTEVNSMKDSLAEKWVSKEAILEKVQDAYDRRMEILESGKAKAMEMIDSVNEETVNEWLESAKKSLDSSYQKAQKFFQNQK